MKRSAVLSLLAWGALQLGCGTVGLSLDELPTDPIAVIYWEGEDARRRAEILDEERIRQERARRYKRGVARADALGRLLGVRGSEPDSLSRFPGRLALVDPRTAEVRLIAEAPPGALPLAWSDDHDRLLFLSNHRGAIQVYEFSRSNGEVRAVTTGRSAHIYADFGGGEQHALLEVVTEGKRRFERVYVTDETGTARELVFEDRRAEMIRLSPDGQTLLYVRVAPRRSGLLERATELVSVDLASGEEQILGPGREPSFSPIGDWIVYSAPSRDGWRLRRMRLDGSARSPIASGIRDEKLPSVSPDGRFIVYVGETNGLERLFVRRMDGTGDRILLDAGSVLAPAW